LHNSLILVTLYVDNNGMQEHCYRVRRLSIQGWGLSSHARWQSNCRQPSP